MFEKTIDACSSKLKSRYLKNLTGFLTDGQKEFLGKMYPMGVEDLGGVSLDTAIDQCERTIVDNADELALYQRQVISPDSLTSLLEGHNEIVVFIKEIAGDGCCTCMLRSEAETDYTREVCEYLEQSNADDEKFIPIVDRDFFRFPDCPLKKWLVTDEKISI